ncbi:cytochrome c [Alcaligenaceae bacterium A4P071]|nr:cytochrome c [Alcaligenaceae bacterium A4P071]
MIKRGEYLSRAGDCIACHTAGGGKPFAGGLGIASPLGTIYSTNITPDKDTGIGNYTLEDFDRALRQGKARDGHSLYPAMPYTAYANVTPDDINALYTYFMHGVEPVNQANKDTDIVWPLSMRWPLGIWRWMFAPDPVAASAAAGNAPATSSTPPTATAGASTPGAPATGTAATRAPTAAEMPDAPSDHDALLRGKYLVEGLGHCSSCHTPRGFALQEKAISDADGSAFLSGAVIDNWLAKNLRGDMVGGLGTWTKEDIATFLKSGRNSHAAAFGGMAEVVQDSTQYLTDADLNAIAVYLKSLPPVDPKATTPLAANPATAQALRTGTDKGDGAMAFLNNCAACHRSTGQGYAETFPQLALSSTVNTADPTSLIHIVLKGAQMPGTASAPTEYAMPGFDWRLTDKEVADVVSFVRTSWGNNAAAVSASDVAKVRKDVGAAPQPQR